MATPTENKETNTFEHITRSGTVIGTYSNRQPRQAALKAAARGAGTKEKPQEIILRVRGTKEIKMHVFKGWKETVDAPKNKPAWMKDKIIKSFASKVGGVHTVPKLDGGDITTSVVEYLKKVPAAV